MPNTTYGTPYAQSSDLVSNWPGVSLNVADRIDDVSFKGNGLNDQTGTSYTLVLTDAGKTVTLNNASAVTVTIPTNASVAYEDGTGVTLINKGAGVVTVVAAGGVTLTGESLTINQNQAATVRKLATNTWVMVKGGGLPKASYSTTTGSPSVTTVSGKTCLVFNGSGSITVSSAGLIEILVIGGGGGGGRRGGGGGAGGYLSSTFAYLTADTHTVIVGAGGAGGAAASNQVNGTNGTSSRIGPYYAIGGGGASGSTSGLIGTPYPGGSGGGGYSVGGSGMSGQGSDGGAGGGNVMGGGGGASGVGSAGAVNTGGNGGNGTASSITGSSVTRAGGGGAGSFGGSGGSGGSGGGGAGSASSATGTSGTANTGGGGGGGGELSGSAGLGANGGSGVVILVFG